MALNYEHTENVLKVCPESYGATSNSAKKNLHYLLI